MKKTYKAPSAKSIMFHYESCMLAGSNTPFSVVPGGKANDSEALSNHRTSIWDNDEEDF